jgi:uncharacterized small protein (DUF1192 family)
LASSPHQPESLAQEITRLKADLLRKENLLAQIETLGQSTAGGGLSTTYSDRVALVAEIAQLRAVIKAKVDQLNGDTGNLQPGVNLLSHRSEYC